MRGLTVFICWLYKYQKKKQPPPALQKYPKTTISVVQQRNSLVFGSILLSLVVLGDVLVKSRDIVFNSLELCVSE